MRTFYLTMCVIGTVVPWIFFGSFFTANGPDLTYFATSLFANGAIGGFASDIMISIGVFWIWSFLDARTLGIRKWWLVLPASAGVGLSLALPLYLFLRSGTDQVQIHAQK